GTESTARPLPRHLGEALAGVLGPGRAGVALLRVAPRLDRAGLIAEARAAEAQVIHRLGSRLRLGEGRDEIGEHPRGLRPLLLAVEAHALEVRRVDRRHRERR